MEPCAASGGPPGAWKDMLSQSMPPGMMGMQDPRAQMQMQMQDPRMQMQAMQGADCSLRQGAGGTELSRAPQGSTGNPRKTYIFIDFLVISFSIFGLIFRFLLLFLGFFPYFKIF